MNEPKERQPIETCFKFVFVQMIPKIVSLTEDSRAWLLISVKKRVEKNQIPEEMRGVKKKELKRIRYWTRVRRAFQLLQHASPLQPWGWAHSQYGVATPMCQHLEICVASGQWWREQ